MRVRGDGGFRTLLNAGQAAGTSADYSFKPRPFQALDFLPHLLETAGMGNAALDRKKSMIIFVLF
ncbi:MAG: hypothetical protein CVU57_07830 [Deltaproteobacteria bacterium HGW-Deltaproteobacteria-15]|jgi:hypothetical protein|nr:MAG: hypothetical protein CVU57_07830 [Deltaproteobacteria bacterium HGW-Deltaproteobacteria-15]